MSKRRYPEDKLFRFHWGSDRAEDGYGRDVADAFSRLGYGGGAIRALDYFEEVKIESEPGTFTENEITKDRGAG